MPAASRRTALVLGARSRPRPASRRRPGRSRAATSASTRARAASSAVVAASGSAAGTLPHPTTMTTSPRAGIVPSAASAASSPSVPRAICSWSLVSSRQTAPGRSLAAGGRQVAQRGRERGPAPRTARSRARRRRSARAARVARGPIAAGTPRTTSAAPRRRCRRPPPARTTRPGSARPSPPAAAHAATRPSPGSDTTGVPGVGHQREVRAAREVREQLASRAPAPLRAW